MKKHLTLIVSIFIIIIVSVFYILEVKDKNKDNEDKVYKILSKLDIDFGEENIDELTEKVKDELLLIGETKIIEEINKGSFNFGC